MVLERRCRIASVYQVILPPCMSGRLIEVGKNWLLAFLSSTLVLQLRESGSPLFYNGLWRPGPSHPVKLQRFEPPSKSDERIKDSGPHARNLMNVSRILLFAFSVLARLSFCSFWFVFRIRRMSEGFCFFLSKTLTVCSDSVPAEVPFYAFSLEFVECLREFRRFSKCAPPLNDVPQFCWLVL